MSDKYLKESKKGPINMREWSSRKTVGDSLTQQSAKKSTDINEIIRHYTRGELITHVQRFEASFGDVTGIEFKESMDLITSANQDFLQLPSKIRKRFDNNPEKLLEFMEHPENREEAIKLGLIERDWTPETDGLGEHVPQGGNVLKDTPPKEKEVVQ